MKNVYFKKIEDFSNKKYINNLVYDLLTKIIVEEEIKLSNKVPLKVHFGERGNNTFITPDYFEGIRKYLKEKDFESCYIDTNVLYRGSRTNTLDHIKTAYEHRFNDLSIVIADGDDSHPYNEIEINEKHFKKCKIGTKYADYDNFIVVSHFKGHGMAGMGAAIKQLAMGFAARGGKLDQHSASVPRISRNLCISCGACVRKCPVDAITLPDKADINPDICIGCAACSTVCPVNAIKNFTDASNFHEKLAEYAYAAQLNKKNIYITYAMNITNDCDCVGQHQDLIASNIGIFISTDPIAIDTATLDMYEKITGNDNFKDAWLTINYANKLGFGDKEYNLIEI